MTRSSVRLAGSPNRRSLAALAALLATAALARAGDDFKWDPKLKRTPAAGDRHWKEDSEERRLRLTARAPGSDKARVMRDEDLKIKTKALHEVVAVGANNRVSKKRVKLVQFRAERKGQEPDTSLEGFTVQVEVEGDKGTATIEGDASKVSTFARDWAQGSLARGFARGAGEALLPAKPVAQGETWTVDPVAAAAALLPGNEIDPAASKVEGKLESVRNEDGCHFGVTLIEIGLKLKLFPGSQVAVTEGGLFTLKTRSDASLEHPKRRGGKTETTGALRAGGIRETPEGKVVLLLELDTKQTSEEREAGPDDKLDPPPAKGDSSKKDEPVGPR